MGNYKLDMTGEEINNTLKNVENKADKTEIPTTTSELTNDSNFTTLSQVTELIAKGSGGSGIGIEVGTIDRNTSNASVKTLNHPSLFVIANNGRQNYYDELSSMGSNELSFTVLLTPGKSEDTCANAANKRQDTLSLSADGQTLTLSAKGWSCTYISFYQL